MPRTQFKTGDRVEVTQGSGIDSGKRGNVVGKTRVRLNGRGIPNNVQGAYKPVDWRREVPVELDSGVLIIMFKNRLNHIEKGRN